MQCGMYAMTLLLKPRCAQNVRKQAYYQLGPVKMACQLVAGDAQQTFGSLVARQVAPMHGILASLLPCKVLWHKFLEMILLPASSGTSV